MIKSPADALLKHRFVLRQVSCVAAQGGNVLLSGRTIDGFCPIVSIQFSSRASAKSTGQPPGAVLQRCFCPFSVNRFDTSWFTVPTQSCSRCDIC